MNKKISSVAQGYFILIKTDLPEIDLPTVRQSIYELGYDILTDNAFILFCKHNNFLKDSSLVKRDFESFFGFEPCLFENLQDFFTQNDL